MNIILQPFVILIALVVGATQLVLTLAGAVLAIAYTICFTAVVAMMTYWPATLIGLVVFLIAIN